MSDQQDKKKYPYRTKEQCKPWYPILYAIAFVIFRFLYGLKVKGRENLPEGPAVICPRHCSTADPPLVAFGMKMRAYPRIMAKQELIEIPVMGKLLYLSGVFGVSRGSNDMASIKSGLKCLKEGSKLVMFPEGTRVKEGETPTAKTGAIMFALKAGVPLVPVYLTRSEKFHTTKMVIGKPYMPQVEGGKKASQEEYQRLADELLAKIYELESQI